jgi:predicted DNA-binding ribbon-helix-helix protein
MCVVWENLTMDKFEEIGRRRDEEVTRLFQYIEEEVAPETERRTASFLRTVSAKLTEEAAKLEARRRSTKPLGIAKELQIDEAGTVYSRTYSCRLGAL